MLGESNINRLSVINNHTFWDGQTDRQTNIAPTRLITHYSRDRMIKARKQKLSELITLI